MNSEYTITIRGVGIHGSHPTNVNDADHVVGIAVQTLDDNLHIIASATFVWPAGRLDLKDKLGLGPSEPVPMTGGTTVEPPPNDSESWTLLQRSCAAAKMPAGATRQGLRDWAIRDLPEWLGMTEEEREVEREKRRV